MQNASTRGERNHTCSATKRTSLPRPQLRQSQLAPRSQSRENLAWAALHPRLEDFRQHLTVVGGDGEVRVLIKLVVRESRPFPVQPPAANAFSKDQEHVAVAVVRAPT